MTNPTLSSWLAQARAALAFAGSAANLEARLIARAVLQLTDAQLITNANMLLTSEQVRDCEALLARRIGREPMAYLLGRKQFLDFELTVDPRVLIPRPETEAVVEMAAQIARTEKIAGIYEVGTGSGAIAIGLARALPDVPIIASDISPDALELAKLNLGVLNLGKRITLKQANLSEHIIHPEYLVVANLPYLPDGLNVEPELQFEPAVALWSGADGLDHYKQLLAQAPNRRFVLELGADQYEPLRQWILQSLGAWQIGPIVYADQVVGLEATRA